MKMLGIVLMAAGGLTVAAVVLIHCANRMGVQSDTDERWLRRAALMGSIAFGVGFAMWVLEP